jgi:hypothetical protein
MKMTTTTTATPQPRFPLGRLVATPGAVREIPRQDIEIALARHARADWGDVCGEDQAENDFSLKNGLRLLSAYHTGGKKFWIITEADRSATTVLLPDEY